MRKKLKISLFVVSGVGILITISFLVLRLIKPPKAALLVESSPNSTAFVNGEQVGRTPYEGEFSAGEVVIKLIPDSFESPLAPYQSTVDLVAGIKTVVRRSFGDTDDTSAGEVVSFERIGGDKASLSVISIPDGAQVSLDSQTRGRTPIKITDLETKKEGWVTNQYARKVENNPEASPSPSPSPTPIPKASPSPTPIATP